MCLVDTPPPPTAVQHDLPVLHNSYLDGVNPIIRGSQRGYSALRIDRDVAGSETNTGAQVTSPASPGAAGLIAGTAAGGGRAVSTPYGSQVVPSSLSLARMTPVSMSF